MRRLTVRVVAVIRSFVLAGALAAVLVTSSGWVVAEESTTTSTSTTSTAPSDSATTTTVPSESSAAAPLFSMDAYAQARAGVDSLPWSDPLVLVQGSGHGYVTRGELAVRLADLLDLENSTACYFTDVIGPEDCFGAVGALYESGLLSRETSSAFLPDRLVSREQAAVWIVAALEYKLDQEDDSTVPIRFSFYEPVDPWLGGLRDREMVSGALTRGVANAYRLGIIEPSDDGYLYPGFAASESDLQEMLDRAFTAGIDAKTAYPAVADANTRYPELEVGSEGPLVWQLEYQLAALKYRPGAIDGIFDVRTRDAVYAFQKLEKLTKDGVVGTAFWERLATAETPEPVLERAGDRVEVDLGRQVLFMIRDNEVTKIVHVSSGKSKTQTLWGEFTIDKKIPRWLHDSYNTTMYYSSFFSVGHRLAFHGYSQVPTWPASHGCVRTPIWMSKELYEEMPLGMHVYIYR